VAICLKFEEENLSENILDEMDICKIGPGTWKNHLIRRKLEAKQSMLAASWYHHGCQIFLGATYQDGQKYTK
jgi:hypothetical protein